MIQKTEKRTVLIAEDDEEDFMFARDAFQEQCPRGDLRWVRDGQELMEYLSRRGRYQNPVEAPWPSIILLDLNLPKKSGREALREIKSDPELRQIPIVALTGSFDKEDVFYCYSLGANSYLRKPIGFRQLIDFMKVCYEQQLDLVKW